MANFSYNTIVVKGKRENVIAWLNKARKFHVSPNVSNKQLIKRLNTMSKSGHGLTLHSFLPIPKTYKNFDTTNDLLKRNFFKGTDEEYTKYVKGYKKAKRYQMKMYGVVGWYDWNLKFLGCKWDSSLFNWSIRENNDDFILIFNCDTPWNYPSSWIETMQKQNDKLTFFCRAQEESCAYNGYFCAREKEFENDYPDLWKDARQEVRINHPDIEEESDEWYNALNEIEERMNDKLTEKFYQFVENYVYEGE